ncbi:MAG: hypothetical protein ACOYL6_16030 [Bacteriovoracaceae bacterium]
MAKIFFCLCAFLLSACSISKLDFKPKKSLLKTPEQKVIEDFYRGYFVDKSRLNHLPFSKSFNQLVSKNAKICEKYAGTDVCGWGADGDLYLHAQEYDPNLSFENSKFQIEQSKSGLVVVRFNIYPSITDAGNFYDREFQFVMIQEEGKWVVDDMIADGESSRKLMEDEILVYTPKVFVK